MKPRTDITVEEMYEWLAHIKKHVLQEYWIMNDLVLMLAFRKYMARDCYTDILWYLNFASSMGLAPNDRL